MKKIKCIFQSVPNECGACCSFMILKFFGYHTTLEEVRKQLGVGRDGIQLKSIKSFFESKYFDAKVYNVNVNGLVKLKLPAILTWKNNHYVILESINKNSMTIVDPNLGRTKLSFEDIRDSFTNYALCINPNYQFIKNKKPENTILKYFKFIFKQKNKLYTFIFTSLLYYLFTLSIPVGIKYFVDEISTGKLLDMNKLIFLFIFLLIYSLLILIKNIKKLILGNEIYKNINYLFFFKLLHLPYSYFEMHTPEDIMFRTKCLDIVDDVYSNQLTSIIFNIGILTILIIYTSFQSLIITSILFIMMIISGLIMYILIKKINKYHILTINDEKNLNSTIYEIVYSSQHLKTLGIEDNVMNSWTTKFEKTFSSKLQRDKIESLYSSTVESITSICPFIIFIIIYLLNDFFKFSIGDLLSFYYLTSILLSVETALFSSINGCSMSLKYLEKIDSVIENDSEKIGSTILDKNSNWQIELKDVSFKYNQNTNLILNKINMKIDAKKVTAIVGKSGSGKSTIIKLILGLLDPTTGSVFINNTNLLTINKSEFKKKLGVVPQNVNLLNNTLYENIIVDNENTSLEEVINICKIVHIHEDIEKMPMGYNTVINSSGSNLSGGQKQKIALARALIKKPKLLILDEATNCLDSINEKNIIESIQNIGCSIIIVTHKLKQIKNADNIYVIYNGEIKEQGSHINLISNKGIYYSLYNENL